MTACPSDTIAPAHGDFILLVIVIVNIGPGAITPDNEVTITVQSADSIRLL
jgi:hypothetical protein